MITIGRCNAQKKHDQTRAEDRLTGIILLTNIHWGPIEDAVPLSYAGYVAVGWERHLSTHPRAQIFGYLIQDIALPSTINATASDSASLEDSLGYVA